MHQENDNNRSDSNGKIESKLFAIDILIGLLALVIGIISIAPITFFGYNISIAMLALSYFIFYIVFILAGVSILVKFFSPKISELISRITVATGILVIIPMVIILFINMTSAESTWFHYLVGLGMLSYVVGRIAFSLFSNQFNRGLKVFVIGICTAIGVLSAIVFWFRLIPLPGNTHTYSVYLGWHYFATVALVLVGVDLLLSSTLVLIIRRQKESLPIQMSDSLTKKISSAKH